MSTEERRACIAAAWAPVRVLAAAWTTVTVFAIFAYAATVSSPTLGNVDWHDAARAGTSIFLLATGGPGRLTLDAPTGAITVGRLEAGAPTSEAPTSRGNVARVIAAVLAEPASIGRVIPFRDGDTPIAQAVADVPLAYADLS